MKILIVEDSPTDRDLLKYLLEDQFQNEAKFREASNLETALKYLIAGNIDCVILDLQLPDSVGRETFDKIYDRHPDVPIIVMTHNKDRDIAVEMIKAGAADYILKNYTNPEDIFNRIIFAVEKHRRTVRVSPEKASVVHHLERSRADMMSAHKSGEHAAIQSTTVATTSAVADLSRKMFTEIQVLSSQLAQKKERDDHIVKIVENLETEILKGGSGRPSMRSQMDLLDHRVSQTEKRLSDFRELADSDRMSIVQIQQTRMTTRAKIVVGILTLLGVIATAVATYEAAKHAKEDAAQREKP